MIFVFEFHPFSCVSEAEKKEESREKIALQLHVLVQADIVRVGGNSQTNSIRLCTQLYKVDITSKSNRFQFPFVFAIRAVVLASRRVSYQRRRQITNTKKATTTENIVQF